MKTRPQQKPTEHGEHDLFKRFIDTSTLLIIAGGLYFAWDQANKLNENLEVSNRNNTIATWNAISSQGMDLDKIFIDNPGFQKYFYSGVAIKEGDPGFAKASAIAGYVLDYFDSAMNLIRDLPQESSAPKLNRSDRHANITTPFIERDVWNDYFTYVFHSSPLLCSTLKSAWSIYGTEMRRIGGKACNITPSSTH